MVKAGGGIYLFCGVNDILHKEARDRLISKILPQGQDDLNYSSYDAKEDYAGIIDALKTLPFLSSKRVVVIKGIEDLPEQKKIFFLAYLKNPTKDIYTILHSNQGGVNNKFLKAISQYAKTSIFRKPTPREARGWVHNRLRQERRSITQDALDLLMELKGQDLTLLSQEIEKLALYSGAKKTIYQEDIVKLVGKSSFKTAFNLVDAIGLKDRDTALSLMSDVQKGSRKAAPEMIGLIGWQLRRIWKAKSLLSKKMSRPRVCSELNIKDFSTDKFFRQVESFEPRELKRGFSLLVETDRSIKLGRKKPEFALEELVIKLCGSRAVDA